MGCFTLCNFLYNRWPTSLWLIDLCGGCERPPEGSREGNLLPLLPAEREPTPPGLTPPPADWSSDLTLWTPLALPSWNQSKNSQSTGDGRAMAVLNLFMVWLWPVTTTQPWPTMQPRRCSGWWWSLGCQCHLHLLSLRWWGGPSAVESGCPRPDPCEKCGWSLRGRISAWSDGRDSYKKMDQCNVDEHGKSQGHVWVKKETQQKLVVVTNGCL